MSNTFMEIKSYKTLAQFRSKLSHNGRKKSLSIKDKDKPFLNQIMDNRNILNNNNKNKDKNKNMRTKSDISKDISRFKYKLKRTKNIKTKEKYENKIKELELERNLFVDKRTTAKNSYFDFVFSLTNVKKDLKKNLEYGSDLQNLVLEYFKEKFPNAQITMSALHLDQSNPHMHISCQYPEVSGISLTNDLNNSFGDIKFHYQAMQIDFNSYVKNSELVKKHDLKIEDIVKGGRKEYMKLGAYKALEATFKEKAINDVQNLINGYKSKGMSNSDIFKSLKSQLVNTHKKHLASKDYIYKSEKSRNVMELKFNKKIEILEENLQKVKTGGKDMANLYKNLKSNYDNLKLEHENLKLEYDNLDDFTYKLEKKIEKGDNTVQLQINQATKQLQNQLKISEKERIYALEQNHQLKSELEELKGNEISFK